MNGSENYTVVLAPLARDDIDRIGGEAVVAAIYLTIDHDLAPVAGGPVRIWREYPYYLYIAVPSDLAIGDTLQAEEIPEEEPSDELPLTYFVLYKPLTRPQRDRLADRGYPSYLVMRVVKLDELLRPLVLTR